MESELEERDAMDWLMDDETMRQWEEVGEEGRGDCGEEE